MSTHADIRLRGARMGDFFVGESPRDPGVSLIICARLARITWVPQGTHGMTKHLVCFVN